MQNDMFERFRKPRTSAARPVFRRVGWFLATVLTLVVVVRTVLPRPGLAQTAQSQSTSRYGYHCVHTEARDRQLRARQNAVQTDAAPAEAPAQSSAERPAPSLEAQGDRPQPGDTSTQEKTGASPETTVSSSPHEAKATKKEAAGSEGESKAAIRQRKRARRRAMRKSTPPTGRNALGISVGLASGTGLSYRHYFNNFFALRIDGGIIANTRAALYSVGLTAQEDFLRTYFHRLYALQAFAVHGGPGRILLVPGAGAGYEYNFSGMRRGLSLRGECVLSPLFVAGEPGPVLFTFLPQVGVSFVF